MMKEKLIELLKRFEHPVMFGDVEVMKWSIVLPEVLPALADYLIDNGVTIPVRCKDCKHHKITSWGERYCIRDGCYEWGELKEDDFCSFGERRADENKNKSTVHCKVRKRSSCRKRQL